MSSRCFFLILIFKNYWNITYLQETGKIRNKVTYSFTIYYNFFKVDKLRFLVGVSVSNSQKLIEWIYREVEELEQPYRGLECKSRKSGNTWSNRQFWPWSIEWSRAKANWGLPREHTGHSKHPFPTTQEKTLHMDITRCSTPKSDWLYSLQPKIEI